jgi:hypothetical protein
MKLIITESQLRTIISEANFKYDIPEDEHEFLKRVKTLTPDLYNRFLSMVKNKGLEVAKQEYMKIDPEVLKQKEKDEKRMQTLNNRKEKLSSTKILLPNKTDIKNSVNRVLLDSDFRRVSQELLFPQLTVNNLEYKVNTHTMNHIMVTYKFDSRMRFKSMKDLDSYILSMRDNDSILDDIITSRKIHKQNKDIKKWSGKYGEDIDNFWDMDLVFMSTLEIKVEVRKGQIGFDVGDFTYVTTTYRTGLKPPGQIGGIDDKVIVNKSAVSKGKLGDGNGVNDYIINSLIKLRTILMDDREGIMKVILSIKNS